MSWKRQSDKGLKDCDKGLSSIQQEYAMWNL